MSRYYYRTLSVRTYDKWGDERGRKRGGDKPDRMLIISDSAEPESFHYADVKGDDYWAFRRRVQLNLAAYLNTLGESGWQVIAAPTTPAYSAAFMAGDFLLMRTE